MTVAINVAGNNMAFLVLFQPRILLAKTAESIVIYQGHASFWRQLKFQGKLLLVHEPFVFFRLPLLQNRYFYPDILARFLQKVVKELLCGHVWFFGMNQRSCGAVNEVCNKKSKAYG